MSVGQGPTDHARITGAFHAQRKLDAIEPTRARLLALAEELESDAEHHAMGLTEAGETVANAYSDAAARLRGVLDGAA